MKSSWIDLALVGILAFILGAAFAAGMTPARSVRISVPAVVAPATPAPLPFEALARAEAVPTVRILKGDNGSCSAVVIATGYAVTALHCKEAGDAKVDGHSIAKWREFSTKDIAVVEVPGLLCPCATLGKKAQIGERVAAVGFAYGLGTLLSYGEAQGDLVYKDEVYLNHNAFTEPGMSGGGVFALREGRAVLVAVTSRAAGSSALSVTVEGVPVAPAGIEG